MITSHYDIFILFDSKSFLWHLIVSLFRPLLPCDDLFFSLQLDKVHMDLRSSLKSLTDRFPMVLTVFHRLLLVWYEMNFFFFFFWSRNDSWEDYSSPTSGLISQGFAMTIANIVRNIWKQPQVLYLLLKWGHLRLIRLKCDKKSHLKLWRPVCNFTCLSDTERCHVTLDQTLGEVNTVLSSMLDCVSFIQLLSASRLHFANITQDAE